MASKYEYDAEGAEGAEMEETWFSDDQDEANSFGSEDDRDDFGYEVKWPSTHSNLPSIRFLEKNRPIILTRPPQIDGDMYTKFEKHMASVKELREKKEAIQAKIEVKSAELQKAESKPKTFGSKWSDKAKGQDAEVVRLSKEVEVLQKSLHEATVALSKADGSNEALIRYVNGHRNLVKMYEDGLTAQHVAWDKLYGKHTPITSLEQLKHFYKISSVTPGVEEGTILIKFTDDMEVGRAYRELTLGGHEYICRRTWDSLEVFESAFTN